MTSAATTPILTLDTQTTGSTGKLGPVGCAWTLDLGVLFDSALFLKLEHHQENHLSASLNYIVIFLFHSYVL